MSQPRDKVRQLTAYTLVDGDYEIAAEGSADLTLLIVPRKYRSASKGSPPDEPFAAHRPTVGRARVETGSRRAGKVMGRGLQELVRHDATLPDTERHDMLHESHLDDTERHSPAFIQPSFNPRVVGSIPTGPTVDHVLTCTFSLPGDNQ
jgi:hypothetical protein